MDKVDRVAKALWLQEWANYEQEPQCTFEQFMLADRGDRA